MRFITTKSFDFSAIQIKLISFYQINSTKNQLGNILTQSGFDKLLTMLDENREQAGTKYELLRARLIKFFEWRNCETPEELTDIVFDRIAKKITEGEQIQNINAYAAATANFVYKESLNNINRRTQSIDETPELEDLIQATNDTENEIDDTQVNCLRKCLAAFSDENRRLIVAYYDTDERTMIPARKRLADSLAISLNTLRIRVCRLKAKLEECVWACSSNAE